MSRPKSGYPSSTEENSLRIRLLGEIELARGVERIALPQSKKTRALLAYLVATGKPHRRDRLCAMLWDATDDPRGALRWSLSKLRPLVDEEDSPRIVAEGESVGFVPNGAVVDVFEVRKGLSEAIERTSTEVLKQLAGQFRGEFLEGLDLPDFHEFQSWCVAEREQARLEHAHVLGTLIARSPHGPDEALAHSRALVRIDPLNEAAQATLLRLLVTCGRRREAEEQYAAATHMLRELDAHVSGELERTWEELKGAAPQTTAPATAVRVDHPVPLPDRPQQTPLAGRAAEMERILTALGLVETAQRERVILLTGEPGVGKSRMLSELIANVQERAGTVLVGSAFEVESGRPYGPWIEALGRIPAPAVGKTLGTDLAPLRPDLPTEHGAEASRDRLFGAVVELLAARAHSAPPVLLAFDDVHWCDEASAGLLHYVARMNRHRPLLVALAAREAELPDNAPMLRLLRWLRRDGLLQEIPLDPLNVEETEKLIRSVAPDADAQLIYEQSAGNPLYALEAARSAPSSGDEIPPTLAELVLDRVGNLSSDAVDVLRWGTIIGPTFDVNRLGAVAPLKVDGLMSALEVLERHALLQAAPHAGGGGGTYSFSHDLVRQVLYRRLSEPRRRLMHLRVAHVLDESSEADETIAADVAYHAGLGGDAGLAARACVGAGERCLRLFASTEAESLARRGLYYADGLKEPERTKRMLELNHVSFAARRPDDPEESARRIRALSERALDHGCPEHARLGFHMLAHLHWEGGDWSGAQRETLRAEQVSRSGDERERIVAMGEAARCLLILERDLGRAEAMVLEAGALSTRLDVTSNAIPDAEGMLRTHEGHADEAARLFEKARGEAHDGGDRLGEFHALEHHTMLEYERGEYGRAHVLSQELVSIGNKLREGSEAPFAAALEALSRYALGQDGAVDDLSRALDDLRIADAKHRLAYGLTRAAQLDIERGHADLARRRSVEALAAARALARTSEVVLSLATLVRTAEMLQDNEAAEGYRQELGREPLKRASRYVRGTVDTLLSHRIGEAI